MKLSFRNPVPINSTSITLFIILVVVALFLSGIPLLEMVELKAYDLYFRSRQPLQSTSVVVMALIDEKGLKTEGHWPWPRDKIARIVDILSQRGAKVIGFDIGFFEPSVNSYSAFTKDFGHEFDIIDKDNRKMAEFIKKWQKNADHDLSLADAITNSSAAVVLGYFFHMDESALNYRLESHRIDAHLDRISSSKYPLIIYKDKDMERDPFIQAFAPVINLDIFTEAANSSGFFSLGSDQDGVVRWIPLIIKCGEDLYPPLSLLCAWHYLGNPQLMVKIAHYGIEGIRMGNRFVPTDESGRLLINYLGPPGTIPQISISDLLAGRISDEAVKDKIVLIGATAMGTHDLRSTPVSPLFPGVEIHATVIENILSQEFMTKPLWSKIFDILAIVLLGVLTGIAMPRLNAVKGLALVVGLFLFHNLATRWLFIHCRMWLSMVFPVLVLSLNYTALTAYRFVTEEKERKKVKGVFRQFVAPLVIEELLEAPEKLKLGGEEKYLTVLFSDIEGFTTYAEHYSPSEIVDILSDYYDRMTEQIFRFRGTLKEYVGDEIMAFFGAPLNHPDHAQKACAAALAMREQRNALNSDWVRMGRPQLGARTGINTGPMLVGNLGSRYRFAYGVLGDQVNLGSRIEGLNKIYGTDILLGENTARVVKDDFLLRKVDVVRVKGRKQCVGVFELVADTSSSVSNAQHQSLRTYAAGYEAYCDRRWDDALGLFHHSLELWPKDGPSRTMARRCRIYKEVPPPEGWEGVYEPMTK